MKSVSSLWLGGPLGVNEILCLGSFSRKGVPFELYSFADLNTAIPGVVRRNPSEVIPLDDPIWKLVEAGSYSLFSNVFRYELINKTETIWVDMDILLMSNSIPSRDGYVFGFEEPFRINSAVLGAPVGSKFSNLLVSEARRRIAVGDTRWGRVGPELVTDAVAALELWEKAFESDVFYPIYFREAWRFFDPGSTKRVNETVSDSTTVHLWNEVIKGPNKDLKNFGPPPGSWLSQQLASLGLLEERPLLPSSFPSRFWRKHLNPLRAKLRGSLYAVLDAVSRMLGDKAYSRVHQIRRFFKI